MCVVPQLCHLIVSIDNESMALEEFILDLCEESVTGALLVCNPLHQNCCPFAHRPFC